MTLPRRKTLLANAVSLMALVWLYGGDLRDALRARDAEVAAYAQLPSPTAPVVVLVLTSVAVGVVGWGLLRREGEGYKGYRLLPMVLVGVLMVDLVRSESTGFIGSAELTAAALQEFRDDAEELASPEAVPSDEGTLRRLVEKLGPAPYLSRGQPVGGFSLQVRQGCTGPAREPQGARPGTLIYCVGVDRQEAWISAVGLPRERRFGTAEMVSAGGVLHVAEVKARPPAEPLPAEGELPNNQALPRASEEAAAMDSGVAGPGLVP